MGFGKDGKGVIINDFREQALGTLAENTAILVGTKLATLERFRILKSEITVGIKGLTALEGGGLALYLCDGNLTIAEIEAAIETEGPLGPNDTPVADVVEEAVFQVGILDDSVDSALTVAMLHDMNTNSSVMIVKPRWTYARTKSWNWVIYNKGTALTTGSTAKVMARNFGVWVGI